MNYFLYLEGSRRPGSTLPVIADTDQHWPRR